MATYGKKKRPILPSFSSFRDFDGGQNFEGSSKKRDLKVSPFNNDTHDREYHRDDSIEELASILLDDTTMDQLKPDPGRRLSQIGRSQTLSDLGHTQRGSDKALPSLPGMSFNGDDAWASKTSPVVTADGALNHTHFPRTSDDNPSLSGVRRSHSKKSPAPTIPRKSSRRKTRHLKGIYSKLPSGDHKKVLKSSISPPKPLDTIEPPNTTEPVDVENSVQKMLAASRALKGDEDQVAVQEQHSLHDDSHNDVGHRVNDAVNKMMAASRAIQSRKSGQMKKSSSKHSMLQGPYLPTKKQKLLDGGVFAKMKNVLADRKNRQINKKRRDSARDDLLLDPENSLLPDFEGPEPVNEAERRANEANNLAAWNGSKLTGSGFIVRKPVGSGASQKSKKSVGSQSLGRPSLSPSPPLTRTPTSLLEKQAGDEMSIDQSQEYVPDLPDLSILEKYTPKVPKSAHRRQGVPQSTEFDLIISSSPVAESTPRTHAEHALQSNSMVNPENIPIDSDSIFGSEYDEPDAGESIEMDVSPESEEQDLALAARETFSVRGMSSLRIFKKHPSPSKAELEELEAKMKEMNRISHVSEVSSSGQDSATVVEASGRAARVAQLKQMNRNSRASQASSTGQYPATVAGGSRTALSQKNPNSKLQAAKRFIQERHGIFKSNVTKTMESIPSLGGVNVARVRSTNAQIGGRNPEYPSEPHHDNGQMSDDTRDDLDPLQWDDSEYDLGTRMG